MSLEFKFRKIQRPLSVLLLPIIIIPLYTARRYAAYRLTSGPVARRPDIFFFHSSSIVLGSEDPERRVRDRTNGARPARNHTPRVAPRGHRQQDGNYARAAVRIIGSLDHATLAPRQSASADCERSRVNRSSVSSESVGG